MITVKNALVHALAYLQAQKAGHAMSMPVRVTESLQMPLAEWCQKNGLAWLINGKTLTLRLLADGESYSPPDPTIPPVGTPLSKLHPGNRLRLMMGQSLLPQKEESASHEGDGKGENRENPMPKGSSS